MYMMMFLGLFAAPIFAQEPVAPQGLEQTVALVDGAGDSLANDGADVVTVLKRTHVKVEDSGLSHINEHQILKCLTEKGAADLARLRFDFDPASNFVEIKELRIIRKNGQVEELSSLGVDLPQPQHGIFWGAQMKLVQLPRLQVGDAVEVKTYMKGFLIAYLEDNPWGATTQQDPWGGVAVDVPAQKQDSEERYIPPMRGHFYDIVYFESNTPVKQRHYTVELPISKDLEYEVHNGEVASYVSVEGDQRVYRFWKEDLKAFASEGYSSADFADVSPKVVMATVPDWKKKSQWFFQVNKDQFNSTPEISEKVRELTAGLNTDDARISAINHWVADNIRYSGISMGEGEGYTLHTGEMIYNDRSGVCKDKAGMAITMLRAAGYSAYPAMTMAGSRVERVAADQFNHCIVALNHPESGWQLLDPTWIVYSPEEWSSAEGEQHFLIGTPDGQDLMITKAFLPEDNKLMVRANSEILSDGTLISTIKFSALGYAEQGLRRAMAYSAARERQQYFEDAILRISPNAEVEPVKVDYQNVVDVTSALSYTVKFKVPNYALVSGNELFFAPPTAEHLLTAMAPYLKLKGERKRDSMVWTPRMRDVIEEIKIPAGYEVVSVPQSYNIDGDYASLLVQTDERRRTLLYTQQIKIKQRNIPAENFPEVTDVVQKVTSLPEDLVVVRRK